MDIEITRIANGLTVVTDPMPQLESTAVGVWVDCGARNETRAQMGLSHMLEHMAFKGTARRNARQIAEEIEAVGGYLNAYTSREQTAFHARILKADVPLAVDILADILTSPAFEAGELERERQVVLQEIGQARDTPDDIIFDHLQSVAFPDQPMGWPILGDEDSVGSFAREDLKTYMAANYRAGAMTLISSGAVEHARMVELAEEKFANLPRGESSETLPARYEGGDLRLSEPHEQAHVVYGFPGIAGNDPDIYAAQVYVTALGGGMSSRLFQEVREKRGLCYSVYAFANAFRDGGLIGIYAGTGEDEAAGLSAVVAGEMASLAETANADEIARAKAQLKSGLLMGLERPAARAEQIASQLLSYGRVLAVSELTEKLEAVDVSAVRRFGSRLMQAAMPALVALGPVNKLETYSAFANRFGAVGSRAAE
ncbi:MAG: insulinase family protein [Alphaproteobacteria bacterium]|nr:insulinase family protein [Alphaproteobacteria bacterium]